MSPVRTRVPSTSTSPRSMRAAHSASVECSRVAVRYESTVWPAPSGPTCSRYDHPRFSVTGEDSQRLSRPRQIQYDVVLKADKPVQLAFEDALLIAVRAKAL